MFPAAPPTFSTHHQCLSPSPPTRNHLPSLLSFGLTGRPAQFVLVNFALGVFRIFRERRMALALAPPPLPTTSSAKSIVMALDLVTYPPP